MSSDFPLIFTVIFLFTLTEFSEDATANESTAVAGDDIIAVSLIPNSLLGCPPPDVSVEVASLPGATTTITPLSVAFFIDTATGLSSSSKPAELPKLIFIMSAPCFTESSIAAIISSSKQPPSSGLLENTFIASNWASGATPFTELNLSAPSPFAATIPATCIPCWLVPGPGLTSSLLSAKL